MKNKKALLIMGVILLGSFIFAYLLSQLTYENNEEPEDKSDLVVNNKLINNIEESNPSDIYCVWISHPYEYGCDELIYPSGHVEKYGCFTDAYFEKKCINLTKENITLKKGLFR